MIQEITPTQVYTYKQLQDFLGVEWRSVRKLIVSGELKPRKIARRYLFTGQMILDYINGKEAQ